MRPRIPKVIARLAGVTSLALLLVACASDPVVRYHSLSFPLPAGQQSGAAMPRLVVAPVRVPSAIDQPQWLVRRPDGSLQLLEQERWASPPADEFRAALREALAARWGVPDGSLQPVAAGGEVPMPAGPAWRLVVEVLRLDAWPGRDSVLEAQWSLIPPQRGAASANCRFSLREPVEGLGAPPLADAHRRAVLRLADDVGRQLLQMRSGGGAACTGPPTS